jgi:hypothetical protein
MSESQDERDESDVRRTSDHTLLRSVIEEHGGYPAHASRSEGAGDRGLLREGFRTGEEVLEEISWNESFDEFDEKGLVGVYTLRRRGRTAGRVVGARTRRRGVRVARGRRSLSRLIEYPVAREVRDGTTGLQAPE